MSGVGGGRGITPKDSMEVEPIRMLEIELSEPLAPIEPDSGGRRYPRAIALIRLHAQPLGLAELEVPPAGLEPVAVAAAIWPEVRGAAAAHLARDGVAGPGELGADGLAAAETPPCISARESFLADAPFLSVLIPSRERPERLRRCLDSILASAYPSGRFEVLVVDNAPETQATRELVDSYAADGRVRYAREDAPGSASARNRGLQHVRGELVAFTDDDVVVDTHWLTEVARAFAATPEASCVSGLLLPLQLDTPAQVWFEEYGGFSRGFEHVRYDLEAHRPADDALYPYSAGIFGTGNNFAFRRSDLVEIGGFDPALGNGTPALGGVDSEVLLRTILDGKTIVYAPAALVWHVHRPDFEGLRRQVYAYGAGLVAYLLKTLIDRPALVPDFTRRIPAGVRFALSPSSAKNETKRRGYPRELTWLELRGMLYGPLAYRRSRRRYGPHRRAAHRRN